MKRKRIGVALGVLMSTSACFAQTDWIEIDDAGAFPDVSGAQSTFGPGLLEHISGSTDVNVGDWVDAYVIDIVAPQFFYATTDPAFDSTARRNDRMDGRSFQTYEAFWAFYISERRWPDRVSGGGRTR